MSKMTYRQKEIALSYAMFLLIGLMIGFAWGVVV